MTEEEPVLPLEAAAQGEAWRQAWGWLAGDHVGGCVLRESGARRVRPCPAPCTPAATPAADARAPPLRSPPSPTLSGGGAPPAQAPPPSPAGGGAFSPAVAKVTVTSPGHRVRNVRAAVVARKRQAGTQPGPGSQAVSGRQYALSWPAWLPASLCDPRGTPVPVLTHVAAPDRPPFPVTACVPSLSTSPLFAAIIILSQAAIRPCFPDHYHNLC